MCIYIKYKSHASTACELNLQYFQPSLNLVPLVFKTFVFFLFLSGRLRQVLLQLMTKKLIGILL